MDNLINKFAADLAAIDVTAIEERRANNEEERGRIEAGIQRAEAELAQVNARIRELEAMRGPDGDSVAEALLTGQAAGAALIDVESLRRERAALCAGKTALTTRLNALPAARSGYRPEVDELTAPCAAELIGTWQVASSGACQAVAQIYADAKAVEIATGSSHAARLAWLIDPLLIVMAEARLIDREVLPVSTDVIAALRHGDAAMRLAYRGVPETVPFPDARAGFDAMRAGNRLDAAHDHAEAAAERRLA